MKIEIKCNNCLNMFITDYKHRDKKFCNRSCYFEYARKNDLLGKDKDESDFGRNGKKEIERTKMKQKGTRIEERARKIIGRDVINRRTFENKHREYPQ